MNPTGTDSIFAGHSWGRWIQRSDQPEIAPHRAWHLGESLTDHGLDAREARYHAPTETVLAFDGEQIVTIIDAHDATGQLRDAIERATGGESV